MNSHAHQHFIPTNPHKKTTEPGSS
jgi:hypothetical protein